MYYDATAVRAAKQARRLAELLMKEMYAGLRDPSRLSSEEWDKLFGAKQSMISNLQKLVATLSALPELMPLPQEKEPAEMLPISAQEIAVLKAWLEEGKVS